MILSLIVSCPSAGIGSKVSIQAKTLRNSPVSLVFPDMIFDVNFIIFFLLLNRIFLSRL
jgi:hypothetical protein